MSAGSAAGGVVAPVPGTPGEAPAAPDVSRPNIARVYDYWLGGKNNFEADRAEAERLLTVYPLLRDRARENRLFLSRAVAWLAAHGIRQFPDVGAGLPTAENTHQAAQAVDPACRVVYADNDPVVLTHARALLSGPGAAAAEGDLRDPAAILADPAVEQLIRPGEPTAVILAMVLHFLDAGTAAKVMEAFTRWLTPGSYVVISCGSGDQETGGRLAREYAAGTLYNHSPAQIAGFFASLDLVPPGLAGAGDWNPGLPAAPTPGHRGGRILAGVGRKPGGAS